MQACGSLVKGEHGARALEVVAAQLQLLQRVHCKGEVGWGDKGVESEGSGSRGRAAQCTAAAAAAEVKCSWWTKLEQRQHAASTACSCTPALPGSPAHQPYAQSHPHHTPLVTWNLTEGPPGALAAHRYRSLCLRASK